MNRPANVDVLLQPRPPSPVQEIRDERFDRHGVRLLLKRDDLIHSTIAWDTDVLGPVDLYPPGNKWRKLAPNLRAALAAGCGSLVTFGGAYSNHLRATAAAGRLLGLETVGVVRGDELAARPLNDSLARCAADGMRLHFASRADYRRKAEPPTQARLLDAAGATGAYVIPEGGSNALALRGCAELGRELRGAADVVAVACGTGGTLAGLAAGLAPGQRALGVPVLAGGFLEAEIRSLQEGAFGAQAGDWTLAEDFHHGGYARVPAALEAFAADFGTRHGVPVERVYVAKLLWALTELTAAGAFAPGTTLAAVVTGRP
ncbi:1-aminocyclopropane-1-carboxylate deaminase/D-cysteine desulfhydrase [Streptomyces sp. H27-S2]|uniref:1-aminocyclopropane-1-carboxylate deaminase/D-cysteine desulfhydrase n=1 Tax=Streptomyces antarcticus TaxID=2996458 RepID=UPI0022702C40|nr:pyridoxal-phosphate dependent enzyme [Streptomyces sp. H27-S2]MCY0948367.1 pyridoxal-phosphate dependent enzyme [Streptomyces sp. H27-S2]